MAAATSQAVKRITAELRMILKSGGIDGITQLQADEDNVLHWTALLVPPNPPFNKGAFALNIIFPEEYPFKPPAVTFATSIYHPNVDEEGLVCVDIVNPAHWKPTTKVQQVLERIVALVDEPEPSHPVRPELAALFTENHKQFLAKAEEHTKKSALKRP